MDKIKSLMNAIEQHGYHVGGEMLTNSRDWHDLRMHLAHVSERMRMLSANPAITLPGDSPNTTKN